MSLPPPPGRPPGGLPPPPSSPAPSLPPPAGRRRRLAVYDVSLEWDEPKLEFVCTVRRYLGREIEPPIVGRSSAMWNATLAARFAVDDYFDQRGWER